MNFGEMIAQARKIRDAILNGEYAEAWSLTIPLQEKLIAWAQDLGFRSAPEDQESAKELQEALEECKAACDKPPKQSANAPKGKIGDGKILKMLFEMFLKFAPLFFKADPNQPINEDDDTDEHPQPREGTRAAKAQANPGNPTVHPESAKPVDPKKNNPDKK